MIRRGTAPAVRVSCRRGAAILAALLACGTAAAQVLIDPVVVELAPQQRVAAITVTVSDKASAPVRMQAQVFRWTQDRNGENLTEPSNDLLVTPVIAEIRPGQKQLFRVALRGARPTPGELAYRLLLDNISEPQVVQDPGASGAVIKLHMRYDLPVLLAPIVPVVEQLRWKPCPGPVAATEACVRLHNEGNRRVKIKTLTLAGDGWTQDLTFKEGINVLAGSEREWRVPLDGGHALPLRDVRVLTVQAKQLQAQPGG
ncbi:MAG: fimbrial biogenesis chaperone [Telluria sp.]